MTHTIRDSNVDVDSEESTSNQSNDESCGIDKNSKFNNEDDDDDDDEDSDDDSINRTSSDESIDESRGNDNECNVILHDMMPVQLEQILSILKELLAQSIFIVKIIVMKRY